MSYILVQTPLDTGRIAREQVEDRLEGSAPGAFLVPLLSNLVNICNVSVRGSGASDPKQLPRAQEPKADDGVCSLFTQKSEATLTEYLSFAPWSSCAVKAHEAESISR